MLYSAFVSGIIFAVSIGAFAASSADMQEPAYCNPTVFDEKEISLTAPEKATEFPDAKKIMRLHAFKLGKTVLVGAGVGNSPTQSLVNLAEKFAPHSKARKYCTWYLNFPKEEKFPSQKTAANTFNHKSVDKNPRDMSEKEAVKVFMDVLEKSFDTEKNNFLSCLAEDHYLALGCNGMEHRGPTAFGMLLAFSGCLPEHALEITNQIWGLNHVKRKVRKAVIEAAYDLGSKRPEARKKFATLFSAE